MNSQRPLTLYVQAVWAPPMLSKIGNWNLVDFYEQFPGGRDSERAEYNKLKTDSSSRDSSSSESENSTSPRIFDEKNVYLHRPGPLAKNKNRQALVLRQPSVFWDDTCILNLFAKLNNVPVRFHYTDDLVDKSYAAFARFDFLVLFPYDMSQMRFYEFYAMGMPILLPRKLVLAAYIYRGMTSIEDFDFSVVERDEGAGAERIVPNPFERWSFDVASWWSLYTHYVSLPELLYFRSAVDLFEKLLWDPEKYMKISFGMRKRNSLDLAVSLNFWREALNF